VKELHFENREILALCDDLNIADKSHSSAISEANAEGIEAATPKYQAQRKIPPFLRGVRGDSGWIEFTTHLVLV
jgi:hypothetical protein